MTNERLDPRAIERISGPSWKALRSAFSEINDSLLSVSPETTGTLTTIYVKYEFNGENGPTVYSVVWLKKSSETVVGLSLPSSTKSSKLVDPPARFKYAGLTKYFTVPAGKRVPKELKSWARAAYNHAKVSP